ncbi:MAG TPA: hypothetical protein VKT33_10270 [Candidatus Angelobacter sp.]|nr:hypothetical protein [Candidatus Angelobacter sp.]
MKLIHDFTFSKNYDVQVLQNYSLVNPLERFYQFPAELEEQDRSGTYLRVTPKQAGAWVGFFSKGFDSDKVANAVFSCPDPDSLCVAAGGYGYVVNTTDPARWFQLEQRPVTETRVVAEKKLLLFAGFLKVTALGPSGLLWTTERLSWDGITMLHIDGNTLHGMAWDAISDKEVTFTVDLQTGKHSGGSAPAPAGRIP